jgi:hypothetical protein
VSVFSVTVYREAGSRTDDLGDLVLDVVVGLDPCPVKGMVVEAEDGPVDA